MSEQWIFKYQPKIFNDMILDPKTRNDLQWVIDNKPNVLLSSPPGMGKGTFTEIFLNMTVGKENSIWINASDERSIDTMRTKVKNFARAKWTKDVKYIVLNEADNLLIDSQKILLEEIERVQNITRFVLMVNQPRKLIDAFLDRFLLVEFNSPPAKDIYNRCMEILRVEGVLVDDPETKKNIVSLIKKFYPSMRSILMYLWMYTRDKKLMPITSTLSEDNFNGVLNGMMSKDVDGVRKILKSNAIDYDGLYSFLFENVSSFSSPGDAILLIGEYLYRDAIVAIKEINFMTMYVKMIKDGVI